MKKISLILCVLIILQIPMIAYGETTDIEGRKALVAKICLDNESKEVIEGSNLGLLNLDSSSFDNDCIAELITYSTKVSQENACISGKIVLSLGEQNFSIDLDQQEFERIYLQDCGSVFASVVDSNIKYDRSEIPMIADIVINDSFSQMKMNITFGTIEQKVGILLFGEIFSAYNAYVNYLLENQYFDSGEKTFKEVEMMESTATNNPAYVYCNQNHNSSITGGSPSNETVIITASKRDFRDDAQLGASGAWGYEMIRIFGRSQNVKNAISGASSVFPYKATAKFTCNTTNFLQIFDTTPEESNSAMPPAFDLVSAIYPNLGIVIATVNLISSLLSSTGVTKSRTGSNTHYNSVEVAMTIASANASQADLPSASPRATARNNTSNGVSCEICYKSLASNVLTGSVTSSGKMLYKIYTNNGHQMITATTGYASITHNVYYVGA